ncbi:MAG: aminotransferase class I/II-fold pyridoxal phosphate-dependent enzyme [Lachnospiraceae bacterium]
MHNLYHALKEYADSDYYPFHMPGHKRQMQEHPLHAAYEIDITEIEGFDNLHHAQEILLTGMQRAAALYHSEETYYLINGSTGGILSAISATVPRGGTILIARNAHQSAYHAIALREITPIFLYPQEETAYHILGGIQPETIEEALNNHPQIQAVFLTSPTYDGMVSDIRAISKIVHKREIPLIVDEAHGAHFGFHPAWPESSVQCGADIVIHSIHKTLPALTQTALLHVNGTRINRESLQYYMRVYQSSSPSYLLMAGIDECINLVEQDGTKRFEQLAHHLAEFRTASQSWVHIRVPNREVIGHAGIADLDPCKLIISLQDTKMTGQQLYDRLLCQYHLQMEMAGIDYVLAIVTIMDTEEGVRRLVYALNEIDDSLVKSQAVPAARNESTGYDMLPESYLYAGDRWKPKTKISMQAAETFVGEQVPLQEAVHRISRTFVSLYPPGIPILIPGEEVTASVIDLLQKYQKKGFTLQGIGDEKSQDICVIREIHKNL